LLGPVPMLVLSGHTARVDQAQFSPDGQRLLTAGADGTVRLWDVATGTNVYHVTPAGKTSHPAAAFGAFSGDGQKLMTLKVVSDLTPWADATDVVELRDSATGRLLNTISNRSTFRAALSPDGQWVVTLGDSSVRLWDGAGGAKLLDLPGHTFHVVSARFNSTGQWLATGSWDGTARVWETVTGRSLAVLRAPTNVNAVVFTPDGTRLLTVSDSFQDLRLWDWARSPGSSLHAFVGHESFIEDAVFSPDGQWLATGSADGTARIWETATGQCRHVLAGHEGPVRGVNFSPNGRWLVTAGLDRTARIWDVTTGEELCQLGWNHWARACVAFSPDGKHIVTGTHEGEVALYDCEVCGSIEDLKELARRRVPRELTMAERERHLPPLP
ncbi:MAG TPA: WD40 repeat domain-containing protein, partial [Verrucomicrobiae bacterium]|nr:WD40 repeat domain-containing protein [Verrucomicrobiae bacterium]